MIYPAIRQMRKMLTNRIESTVEFIDGVEEQAYEGAYERPLQLKFLGGVETIAGVYFLEFAQPNFYFHVTTAYAILRHNGVKLGKRVYIGRVG